MKIAWSLGRKLFGAFSAVLLLLSGHLIIAGTTTYTIQTGNFTATQNAPNGGGSAGEFNNSSTEVGFFAHNGGQDDATAFQTFSTSGIGSGSITARPLQVGDSFSITMFSALNPFGFEGVYFDDNTTYSSFSNFNTNERTAVVLNSSGNWVIENSGSNVDTGIAANNSPTATLTVTSSNTFNMTITNNSNSSSTTYYDLGMKNAPGTATRIQSFSLIDQNDNNTVSGKDSNFYVKNGSLTNTGSVTIGGSNLSLTVSGIITDGLDSASTSTTSVNSLTKIGGGTMALTGANTYSGGTTVSAGTLAIQSDGNLGAAPSSFQAANITLNGGKLQASGTSTPTLNANRGITIGSNGGALDAGSGSLTVNGAIVNNSTGTNSLFLTASGATNNVTLAGVISGAGKVIESGATATFTTANSYTGDTFVMNGGTLNLAVTNAINGTSAIRLGGDFGNSGSQDLTKGATVALTNSSGGETVSSAINSVSGNTSGALLFDSQNTSGTNTLSNGVFLDSQLRIQQATGGTLVLSGGVDVKAQLLLLQGSGNINLTSVIQSSTGNSGGNSVQVGQSAVAGGPTVTISNTDTYNGDTLVRSGILAFTSAGSANNSAIRLGSTSGTSVNATVALTGAAGGVSLSSVINPVSTSGSGTLTIDSQNTSNTNTLSGHIGLDRNLTINQAAGGILSLTAAHTTGVTDGSTGFDAKNFTVDVTGSGTVNFNDIGNYSGNTNSGNATLQSDNSGTVNLGGTHDNNALAATVNSGTLVLNKTSSSTVHALGSGLTVNNGGTVMLSGTGGDQIFDTMAMSLNGGGTFKTATVSEGTRPTNGSSNNGAAGIGALTLQNTSSLSHATFDFGSGANGNTLAFSSLVGGANQFVDIKNWTGSLFTDNANTTNDRLLFANSPSLSLAQLANYQFFDDNGNAFGSGAEIIAYGNMFELVPVPEPSTWVGAALTLGALLITQRQRALGKKLKS